MVWMSLDLDAAFRDFNFSSLRSPAFPVQMTAAQVAGLVDNCHEDEVADIIVTTLRAGTFEAFQRVHGVHPIDFADWCVHKVAQFLDLIGLSYQPEEIQEGSPATRLPSLPWIEIVRYSRDCPGGHWQESLPVVLEPRHKEPERRGWSRNQRRNEIIQACQQRGESGIQICDALDRQAIPVLAVLNKHHVTRWSDGWSDPELQRNIQQLFSKRKRVNQL